MRRLLAAVAATGAALSLPWVAAAPARAAVYVTITGSGSTWVQPAIDAWRANVRKAGIVVNFSGDGSSGGRLDFIDGQSDFAASEIPFQAHPQDGSPPEISPRPFGYMPDVAGGTSFMYHLTIHGHLVRNLNLDGETIGKIFTGAITNWDDPAIKHDNPSLELPNEPITPVVRSDGSGTSAQFSLYLATEYSSMWNAFCQKYAGVTPPCGLFSFWPSFPGSKAQVGSNGVADYVAATYGEGSIGYVEYAYALNLGFPVANVLNRAGYFVQPTASDVAVALTKATINPDLTQNLTGVYTNPDPRTYPLSSYSYLIVPTNTDSPFNTDKGATLSTFADYLLCAGQSITPNLGYSPLPLNLVQDAFAVVNKIPGHVPTPNSSEAALQSCRNPTFFGDKNVLLLDAPYPNKCQKLGAPANCSASGGGGGGGSGRRPAAGGGGGTTSGGGSGAATGGAGSTSSAGTTGAKGTGTARSGGVPAALGGTGGTGGAGSSAAPGAAVLASTVDVGADRGQPDGVLFTLAGLELAAVVVVPPLVAVWWRRRKALR